MKIFKKINAALAAIMIMAANVVTASALSPTDAAPTVLAKDNNIFSKVVAFLNKISTSLTATGIAIATVCGICLGIGFATGGTQALAKNKPWAIAIVVGIMVICLAPALVQSIQSAIA